MGGYVCGRTLTHECNTRTHRHRHAGAHTTHTTHTHARVHARSHSHTHTHTYARGKPKLPCTVATIGTVYGLPCCCRSAKPQIKSVTQKSPVLVKQHVAVPRLPPLDLLTGSSYSSFGFYVVNFVQKRSTGSKKRCGGAFGTKSRRNPIKICAGPSSRRTQDCWSDAALRRALPKASYHS